MTMGFQTNHLRGSSIAYKHWSLQKGHFTIRPFNRSHI